VQGIRIRWPKMIFFDCFKLDGSAALNGFGLRDGQSDRGLRPSYSAHVR
jgi:hypothetical protein